MGDIEIKLELKEECTENVQNHESKACKVEEGEAWVKLNPTGKLEHLPIEWEQQENVEAGGVEDKGSILKLPLIEFEVEAKNVAVTKSEDKSTGEHAVPPPKPKAEIPPMYSYDITKHIEIFTIDEDTRQIEHKEILSTKRHMRFVCEHCAIGFVISDAYQVHMKVHSPESGSHECEACHSFLKTEDILYRHRLRHYRRYRCLLCAKQFKEKDKANSHVMTDHAGQAFQCKDCHRSFKRPAYLRRHVRQYHTRSQPLHCPVCSKVFYERGWFRSHVRTHNEEVKTKTVRLVVTCDICSRNFHTKASLIRHLVIHETDSTECSICHERFTNRNDLGQHYLKVHNEIYKGAPDSTCPICLRICVTRALLRIHIRRMHTDRTKKYQCDHCQRFYLTKGEVRSHIAWSHGGAGGGAARGHACACGRVLRTAALLRAHRARAHSALPPPREHRCDLCGKAFQTKQVLNRHKKSHSNEMYPCNECGLLFKSQPYVKVHYQIKHLNMTRAQIRANTRKRCAEKPMLGTDGNWEQPIRDKYSNNSPVDSADPLEETEMEDVKIKVERDDDMPDAPEPLLETFIKCERMDTQW